METLRCLPRIVLTAVAGLLVTIVGSLVVIVLSKVAPTSPWIDRTARLWSRVWLAAAGVHMNVEGQHNIDPLRSYVVVANHTSNLDVMVCFLAVPLPIRFLAKKELFSIPLLATAMRSIGIVEVDRSAHAAIHDQINVQAKKLIGAGRSLIIYPEGTRSRVGDLATFKKGAFTMAVTAQLPVLPVTIHGTYEAWPPHSMKIRGGRVNVVVEKPIETTGMTHADTTRLRNEAHGVIETRLAELV
jgi:1-acyl-sn-glycerol-3-phosphate acyltransferase